MTEQHYRMTLSDAMPNAQRQSQQEKLLYVTIRDDISDWIIEHGLSKTESKLFFYFLRMDRFGDKPAKLKVAEILLATGIGKTAYHAAIAKFEALEWFDFKYTDVTISNLTNLSSSEKRTKKPESRTEKPESRTEKPESRTEKPNRNIEKTSSESLEPLPDKPSELSHTIQIYSDLKNTTDHVAEKPNCCVLEKFREKLHFYRVYLEIYDQESQGLIPNPKIATIREILKEMPEEKAERAIAAFLAWIRTAKNVRCHYAALASSLRESWES